MWLRAPTGGKRRNTVSGRAIIHINGVEYILVGEYTDQDSPEFQRVEERIERLVKGAEPHVQYFDVLIDGHAGNLMVEPTGVVSAAVAFLPDEHFAH